MSDENAGPPRRPPSERIPAEAREAVARRSGAAPAGTTGDSRAGAIGASQVGNRRRRRKAAGGRITATGLGVGTMLGIVGALGAHSTFSGATSKVVSPPRARPAAAVRAGRVVPTTTPTTIVWRTVHRVIVVTDAPVQNGSSGTGGGSLRSYPSSNVPVRSYSAPAAPAPSAAPAPVAAQPAPAPAPAPAPPVCSGTKCP